MSRPTVFEFSRSRGVVWVCDVEGSSSRLNSDVGAEETEAFLPRLYWTATLVVEAAGGRFIKWTGDGFLAWFEIPLHRDLKRAVCRCLEAVWHLTVLVNVTQLECNPKRRFAIRHGVTYEQDALLTSISHPGGFQSLDLIGRAVVLAFRLSGKRAAFPSITSHRDIVEILCDGLSLGFKRWVPTAEENLKYFKGEKWGTNSLYASGSKKPRGQARNVAKLAQAAIKQAKERTSTDDPRICFSKSLYDGLAMGPDWSRKVADNYVGFLNTGLLRSLEELLRLTEARPK